MTWKHFLFNYGNTQKTSHFLCICTYFEKSSPDIFMRRKMVIYNIIDPAKKDQKRN